MKTWKYRIVTAAVVWALLGWGAWSFVSAQEAPAQGPVLSLDDRMLLQTLAQLGTVANTECQALDAVKRYNDALKAITTHVEGKYPGYAVDFQRLALVPKAVK